MKSGNLNFLEPSGPLQACNGAALTFTFYMFRTSYFRYQEDHLYMHFLWYVFHAEITIKDQMKYLNTKR